MTDDLEKLLTLFKTSKSPLTAKKIAKKTGTYPATAKRRVEALKSEGVKLKETTTREGRRGFPSVAWVLV
jgi:predicted ArsR family transcriptional regulator